ncbi:MAG: chorismate mutase [Clostridia bacterium]|nr:chorismate mutase [Clostridia bacterium]
MTRTLDEARQALDAVDRKMVALFEERMQVSREIARIKRAMGKDVLDASREAQVLESRTAMLSDAALSDAVKELYATVMRLSREEQRKVMAEHA